MPTYTTNKQIIKPTNGEYVNSWDVPVNSDWDIIDKALGSAVNKDVTAGNAVLTTAECQNQRINATGFSSPNVRTVSVPSGIGGMWILNNANTADVRFTVVGSATVLTIPTGRKAIVYSDGTNPAFADDVRLAQGTGITVVGDTISLTSPVTTALGGTGQTTYANGQLLIGNATGGLTKATLTAGTNVTITNGDGAITINSTGSTGGTGITSLTLDGGLTGLIVTPNTRTDSGTMTFSGVINASTGGTGASTLTGYVYGNGTGVMTASATIPSTAITGLGTMSTQASTAVAITGGTVAGVAITGGTMSGTAITGGTISNTTTARIGTSSALSSAETVSVLAPATTDGVVSRVTTNAQNTFVGQNASGAETFYVKGNGDFIVNATANTGSPVSKFTDGTAHFLNSDEWALEVYETNTAISASGAMAVRVNNVNNNLVEFFYGLSTAPTPYNITGNISTTTSAVSYNTASDYRLKENISDFSGGVDIVKSLRPATFTWKSDPSGAAVTGFIAHEVQTVVPQAVTGEKDAVKPDGSIKAQGIDHSKLVPVLTAAIKELIARVEALEAKA